MNILLSNDDGIFSPGIHALARAVQGVAKRVLIVAPDVEQSASGHSITIRRPLRYTRTRLRELPGIEAYRVDGTPADCVVLGVHNGGRPDVLVSGINIGPNLGYAVTHSGTVAAAIEATTLGIPAIAISLQTGDGELDFQYAADFAARLVSEITRHGLPERTLLNVNFPIGRPKGVTVSRQSTYTYQDAVVKRTDPDGIPYYWVSGTPKGTPEPDTDFTAVTSGYATITPLRLDLTDEGFLAELSPIASLLTQQQP